MNGKLFRCDGLSVAGVPEIDSNSGGPGDDQNCRQLLTAALLAALGILWPANAQTHRDSVLDSGWGPILVNTCLITKNVKALVKFYTSVLGQDAQKSGEDYAEFHTGIGVLAIFSAQAQDRYIPGSSTAAQNRSVVPEFKVPDVDLEYQRLQNVVKIWVKSPTTQPWGTRSIYFRDPDGNLVDFYSRPDSP